MRLTTILLVSALAMLGACGNGEDPHDHDSEQSIGTGHDEHGPHGGVLVELGDHVAHVEILHDDDAGTITLYSLDSGLKPIALSTAPVLNLSTSSGHKQITASPRTGSSFEWVFSDPVLKGEPEDARLRLVLDGVTYTPMLAHHHE